MISESSCSGVATSQRLKSSMKPHLLFKTASGPIKRVLQWRDSSTPVCLFIPFPGPGRNPSTVLANRYQSVDPCNVYRVDSGYQFSHPQRSSAHRKELRPENPEIYEILVEEGYLLQMTALRRGVESESKVLEPFVLQFPTGAGPSCAVCPGTFSGLPAPPDSLSVSSEKGRSERDIADAQAQGNLSGSRRFAHRLQPAGGLSRAQYRRGWNCPATTNSSPPNRPFTSVSKVVASNSPSRRVS